MEFNGWYLGNRMEMCSPEFQQSTRDQNIEWGDFACPWDDSKQEYMVSFEPKPRFDQYAIYPFRQWLPWREEVLYVLHKHE